MLILEIYNVLIIELNFHIKVENNLPIKINFQIYNKSVNKLFVKIIFVEINSVTGRHGLLFCV